MVAHQTPRDPQEKAIFCLRKLLLGCTTLLPVPQASLQLLQSFAPHVTVNGLLISSLRLFMINLYPFDPRLALTFNSYSFSA